MGQYYKFINLDKKEKCDREQYPLKLTEHSYVGNQYCNDILTLLSNEWKGDRVIHVGDYATEKDSTFTSNIIGTLKREFKQKETFYSYGITFKDVEPNKVKKSIRYVYNLDKKQFIDLYHQPIIDIWYWDNNVSLGKFNSFALLTACGNGQGGGDYFGCNNDEVGSWAGDHFVSSEKELEEYKGFKENKFVFYEKYSRNGEKINSYLTYDNYNLDAINNGLVCLDKLIEYYRKNDKMPKYLKVDTFGLTDDEINALKNKNIKELRFKKEKDIER